MVASINGECLRCHFDGPITHPVGIKNTKKNAPDLPLGADGTITCVTCHFGHSNQDIHGGLLRKPNKHGELCLSCHDDL
jgi:predicted CXXCH cytochrome family protein